MELIAEILTNPTTGALEADWPVRSDDVRASQRRIEPRFPTNRLTAIYSTGSGGPERMFCSILDVSQHGMRVRTARPLTPGTRVRVTLREMSAIARVCYCNRVNHGFDQGLHIQEFLDPLARGVVHGPARVGEDSEEIPAFRRFYQSAPPSGIKLPER